MKKSDVEVRQLQITLFRTPIIKAVNTPQHGVFETLSRRNLTFVQSRDSGGKKKINEGNRWRRVLSFKPLAQGYAANFLEETRK